MEIVAYRKNYMENVLMDRKGERTIGEKSGEFCKVKQTPGRLGKRSDAGQWLTPTRDSPTREERLTRVYGER